MSNYFLSVLPSICKQSLTFFSLLWASSNHRYNSSVVLMLHCRA